MGTIGRLITEGDWPHSADWNSLWFALSGTGYVMPVGDECSVSKTGELEISVSSGKISVGLPEIYNFNGGNVDLSSNEGSPDPRYDLIFLEYDGAQDEVVLQKLEGAADQKPKHPDLPLPPSRKVVPVAVVYFEAYASEITLLKNCRTVMDPTHEHTAGAGLDLNSDAVMEVEADEETVTTGNGVVELLEGGIDWSYFDLSMGAGLEGIDTDEDGVIDTLQADLKSFGGVVIDEGQLAVDPSHFDGDGLDVSGNGNLQVTTGDGLLISNEKVKLDVDLGLSLDGTTPDRVLNVDLVDGGGLRFDDAEIEVNPNDFKGAGIETNGEDRLIVDTGDGIEFTTGFTTSPIRIALSDVSGLTLEGDTPNRTLEVDPLSSGGIGFSSSGKLLVVPEHFDGDGLYGDDDNNMNVDPGNGIRISAGSVQVDPGDGMKLTVGDSPNNKLVPDLGNGLFIDSGKIAVDVGNFDGAGLGTDGNDLRVKVGDALRITSDRVTVDPGKGLKMCSDHSTPDRKLEIRRRTNGGLEMRGTDDNELAVAPGDFAGSGLIEDGDHNMEVRDGNGLEHANGYLRVKPGDLDGSGLSSTSSSLRVRTGDGLAISSGRVEVNAGQGLTALSSGVKASLGTGLSFDGSDRIMLDAKDGGGIGFDAGEVEVRISDIFQTVLDIESSVLTSGGYTVPGDKPVFVSLCLTDDRDTSVDGQRIEWYLEEDGGDDMTLWVNNMTGDEHASFKLKVFQVV